MAMVTLLGILSWPAMGEASSQVGFLLWQLQPFRQMAIDITMISPWYHHDITMISPWYLMETPSWWGSLGGKLGGRWTALYRCMNRTSRASVRHPAKRFTRGYSTMLWYGRNVWKIFVLNNFLPTPRINADFDWHPADLEILTSELPVLRNKLRQLCFWRRVIAYRKVSRFPHRRKYSSSLQVKTWAIWCVAVSSYLQIITYILLDGILVSPLILDLYYLHITLWLFNVAIDNRSLFL